MPKFRSRPDASHYPISKVLMQSKCGGKFTRRDLEDVRKLMKAEIKKATGIDDVFAIRFKDFRKQRGKNEHILAVYRQFSQFQAMPIFWINTDTRKYDSICREELKEYGSISEPLFGLVYDNLLHEYGHAIAEWGKIRNKEIDNLIKSEWKTEEEFAESFKDFIRDGYLLYSNEEEAMKKIALLYGNDINSSYK
jgi:hypothetical protein